MVDDRSKNLMPGFSDMPDKAWAGATVEGTLRVMWKYSIASNPYELSLRELAGSVRMRPVSEETRKLLGRLSPEMLEELDKEYASQQNRHFNVYGEYYVHPD